MDDVMSGDDSSMESEKASQPRAYRRRITESLSISAMTKTMEGSSALFQPPTAFRKATWRTDRSSSFGGGKIVSVLHPSLLPNHDIEMEELDAITSQENWLLENDIKAVDDQLEKEGYEKRTPNAWKTGDRDFKKHEQRLQR
jgi:hypothetical protein